MLYLYEVTCRNYMIYLSSRRHSRNRAVSIRGMRWIVLGNVTNHADFSIIFTVCVSVI